MVLESVVFGLISAIGLGVSDLVAVALTRRLGVLRTIVGIQLVAVAVFSLYLLNEPDLGSIPGAAWAQMLGLSALVFGFYVGFYKALQIGPVAVISPIVAAHAVIVVLLAVVFLDERLGPWQSVGVAATIGGVVLASVDLRGLRGGRSLLGLGVLLGVAVSVGAGLWQYGIGAMSRDLGWFLPLYLSRVFLLGMLTPVAAWRGAWPWQGLTRTAGAGIVAVALLETGSLFSFSRGAEIGLVSIVGAAATAYPVVPILGGLFLFRERLAPNQVAGLGALLAGLLGLALAP